MDFTSDCNYLTVKDLYSRGDFGVFEEDLVRILNRQNIYFYTVTKEDVSTVFKKDKAIFDFHKDWTLQRLEKALVGSRVLVGNKDAVEFYITNEV